MGYRRGCFPSLTPFLPVPRLSRQSTGVPLGLTGNPSSLRLSPASAMRMMSPTRLAALFLGVSLSALVGTGCQSAPGQAHNHWNASSASSRAAYNLLGYREGATSSYREHQWEEKRDIDLTLRRHFLNSNPFNPFQAEDASVVAPRDPHSLFPNPVAYFHLESVVTGTALLALSGAFIPLPIGSMIGTFEKGGWAEMDAGAVNTFSGSFHRTLAMPTHPDDFKVHNR